ncbi:MAG: class I SAM-dependent methyltransferase [Candidatus Hodarchaeales archaeon]
MKKYFDANRKRWNELADLHFKGEFYSVKEFKKGGVSISLLEQNEIGDIEGKNILHLQCHFGKDTLSLARLGAKVTGVDFSQRAIELAIQLSQEIGLDATFIQSDIYDLRQTRLKPESFDIVYTSHGAIYWLPDLQKWASLISYYLKPGGFFYIADTHPTGCIFDDENPDDLKVRYPYFHDEKPLEFDYEFSYAEGNVKLKNTKEYGWTHDLGYIVNSLIQAGLRIEFIHEYLFSSWKAFPFLEEKEDGWWHLPENLPQIPLTLTIKARKV